MFLTTIQKQWNETLRFAIGQGEEEEYLNAGANAAVRKAVCNGNPWTLQLIAIFKRDLRLFFSLHELRKLSSVSRNIRIKKCVYFSINFSFGSSFPERLWREVEIFILILKWKSSFFAWQSYSCEKGVTVYCVCLLCSGMQGNIFYSYCFKIIEEEYIIGKQNKMKFVRN